MRHRLVNAGKWAAHFLGKDPVGREGQRRRDQNPVETVVVAVAQPNGSGEVLRHHPRRLFQRM